MRFPHHLEQRSPHRWRPSWGTEPCQSQSRRAYIHRPTRLSFQSILDKMSLERTRAEAQRRSGSLILDSRPKLSAGPRPKSAILGSIDESNRIFLADISRWITFEAARWAIPRGFDSERQNSSSWLLSGLHTNDQTRSTLWAPHIVHWTTNRKWMRATDADLSQNFVERDWQTAASTGSDW